MIQVIKEICELHKKLLNEGKNGIDVILIWQLVSTDNELQKAIYEARELGIFVNSIDYHAAHERAVGCTMYGDVDNPDDYVLYSATKQNSFNDEFVLCMVGFGQTVPCQYTIGSYLFNTTSDMLKSWESGLYLLAKSIKESLTPEEFWSVGLKTGDLRKGIGVIVNPQRLIEALKK